MLRPSPQAALCGFLTALVLAVAPVGAAHAHGGSHGDVEGGVPVVQNGDQLPAGIQLSIVKTNAKQFVLATDGTRQVEILSPDGQAFIRIQAGQVQANVSAKAWHRAQMPGGGAVPDHLAQGDASSKWVTVAQQNGYGWYDRRLLDEKVSHFTLQLRVDGQAHQVDVVRQEEPKLSGYWRASILQEPQGINLTTILTGSSGQAVLMTLGRFTDATAPQDRPSDVEVLDDKNQPFLRLRTQGVWLNISHRWASLLNLRTPTSAQTQWVQISQNPRVHYTDPRLDTAQLEDNPGPQTQRVTRTIGVRVLGSSQTQQLQVEFAYHRFQSK